MKKNYSKIVLATMSLLFVGSSFGQLIPKNQTPINATAESYSQQQISPNLHHHHDGEHCVTDALTKEWIQQAGIQELYREQVEGGNFLARQSQTERALYTIPVIFHVVHNPNNSAENVSEADIIALLNAVNEDFSIMNSDVGDARSAFGFTPADADIQFCMAQRDPFNNPLTEHGINRVTTTEEFYDPDTEANKMKSSTGGNTGTEPWNRSKYLNIWICDITNGASSGTAGYAYKPTISALPPADRDGIVIDYNLGMPPTNRVLTHEIGHYLGLSHTWGNSNEAAGCSEDDGLTDTPNTAGPSFDFAGTCSGDQEVCSGTQTQYENYMDYSNCTVMFSQEQANLMGLVLSGSRVSLTTSDACTPVNPTPPTTDFSGDILSVIQGGAVNFTDESTEYPTSWSWTVTPSAGVSFIGGTTSTDQNPTIQFTNTGDYTIELTATNNTGSDTETKTDYITVISSGGGTTACDTLRNYNPADDFYILGGVSGYIPGTESLGIGNDVVEWAEQYTSSGATQVKQLRFIPSNINDDGGDVIFKVYTDGAGVPGAEVATSSTTIPLSSLDDGFYNTIDLVVPASVNGNFWVGYELSYGSNDTITMLATREIGPTVTNNTFMNFGGAWSAVDAVYGDGMGNVLGLSIVMDVLTSNGANPVASVSFPTTETCEGMDVTMNAYGSQNTTDYFWDISDGTTDYFFDEPNLTSAFNEGSWTFQLIANGSCNADVSSVYNLTVNPQLTGTYTTQDENCIAEDGEIDFNITGGDGGALNYSINNGATVETSNVYTGLSAGDYNYIITDNNNCEITGTVNVPNVNNFNPTISADVTIAQGASTDLTATGGTIWSWYEGNVDAGNTATITVTPDMTTTYTCAITDANGCETTLEVTVTVTLGVDELSLFDRFNVYPNPNKGNFTVDVANLNGNSKIEVVDVFGKVVALRNINSTAKTIEFNLEKLSSGIYFIKVVSDNKTASKKISIQR